MIQITGTHCSVCSQLQVHTAVNYTHSFVNLTQAIRKAKEINQSLDTLRTAKQNQTTVHFQLILKNKMHMLVHNTHCMTLRSVNTIALFTQQQHKSSQDPSDDICRTSNFQCCCFLHNLSHSSTGFGSYLTFTNSLFIKHCQENILNYSKPVVWRKLHNHMILEQ